MIFTFGQNNSSRCGKAACARRALPLRSSSLAQAALRQTFPIVYAASEPPRVISSSGPLLPPKLAAAACARGHLSRSPGSRRQPFSGRTAEGGLCLCLCAVPLPVRRAGPCQAVLCADCSHACLVRRPAPDMGGDAVDNPISNGERTSPKGLNGETDTFEVDGADGIEKIQENVVSGVSLGCFAEDIQLRHT